MIRDLCLEGGFICIHAITPPGGGGKSKTNNEYIDIYERFRFNIEERKGIATSVFRNITGYQKKFGPQGLVIYEGKINNANRSDAGSNFNDTSGLWETTEGINYPTFDQSMNEIKQSQGSYVELNVYEYNICGFFIDLMELDYCKTCIRTLKEFYENTRQYQLPYYGLSSSGIVQIDEDHIKHEDWIRIEGGSLISIETIYSENAKSI